MDMNIQFIDNPYSGKNEVATKGTAISAKVAKTHNVTKKPIMIAKWRKGKPSVTNDAKEIATVKEGAVDHSAVLDNIGISTVSRVQYHKKNINPVGAKKLRVNKIVVQKTKAFKPIEEVTEGVNVQNQELVDQITALSSDDNIASLPIVDINEYRDDKIEGKHVHTGKVPVSEIKEAIKNDGVVTASRMARNAVEQENTSMEEPKTEAKAGDIDLYTAYMNDIRKDSEVAQQPVAPVVSSVADDSFYNKIAGSNDVSRQLQDVEKELEVAKGEGQKLEQRLSAMSREIVELSAYIEARDAERYAQKKSELDHVLAVNLESTQRLTGLREQLDELRRKKAEYDSEAYARGSSRVA